MYKASIAAAVMTLLFSTQPLVAQQPQQGMPMDSSHPGTRMGMGMQQQMRAMDSMTVRLDTLVARMNRATGNAKVTAMAQVINELVAQRRAMQAHMHQMMQSHGEMMRGPRGMEPRKESGADTSGHAEHH